VPAAVAAADVWQPPRQAPPPPPAGSAARLIASGSTAPPVGALHARAGVDARGLLLQESLARGVTPPPASAASVTVRRDAPAPWQAASSVRSDACARSATRFRSAIRAS
jgi:hypothetical protein